MERFVFEMQENLFVDFKNPEILEMKAAVETLLHHLSGSLKKTHPFFEVSRIVPCGSMAEETRNWKCSVDGQYIVEFDYLAQLKYPSTFTLSDGCPGFMLINDFEKHVDKYCNKFKSKGKLNALNQERLAFGFNYDLLKSVSVLCNCYRFDNSINIVPTSDCCKIFSHGSLHKMIQYSEKCGLCKVHKESGVLRLATGTTTGSPYFHGCSLVFEWISNTNQLTPRTGTQSEKPVIVLIDFVPAIELRRNKLKLENEVHNSMEHDNLETIGGPKHHCFLVGKGCNKKTHELCWKISNCVREIQILRETHVSHRHAYMILKFINECLYSSFPKTTGVPTTYKLKTAVLHHCMACSGSPPSVIACVLDILKFLSSSYLKHTLCNVTNGLNLLLPERVDKFPQQHIIMQYNRCELISDCFACTVEFIHQLKTSYEGDCMLKTCSEALKLLGKTYEKAWSSTEVEIIYKIDLELVVKSLCQFMTGENANQQLDSAISKNIPQGNHWTKTLHPIEYSAVRDMYNFHHMHCPEPIGREVTPKERLLIQCKENSGYYQWENGSQMEWYKCMKEDKFAQEALDSVYTVEILYIPTGICRPPKVPLKDQEDKGNMTWKSQVYSRTFDIMSYCLRKIAAILNLVTRVRWTRLSRVIISRLPVHYLVGYLLIFIIYTCIRYPDPDNIRK